jgi:hypothetical protein
LVKAAVTNVKLGQRRAARSKTIATIELTAGPPRVPRWSKDSETGFGRTYTLKAHSGWMASQGIDRVMTKFVDFDAEPCQQDDNRCVFGKRTNCHSSLRAKVPVRRIRAVCHRCCKVFPMSSFAISR